MSYPFGNDSSNSKGFSPTMKNIERERSINDRVLANRLKVIEQEIATNHRAAWSESLDESSMIRRFKSEQVEINRQMMTAKSVFVTVRRSILKELLEKEYEGYLKELNSRSETFYKSRL